MNINKNKIIYRLILASILITTLCNHKFIETVLASEYNYYNIEIENNLTKPVNPDLIFDDEKDLEQIEEKNEEDEFLYDEYGTSETILQVTADNFYEILNELIPNKYSVDLSHIDNIVLDDNETIKIPSGVELYITTDNTTLSKSGAFSAHFEIEEGGKLTLYNGIILKGVPNKNGDNFAGGIVNHGELNINGAILTNCTSSYQNPNDRITYYSSIINTDKLNMIDCEITGNRYSSSGNTSSGVYNDSGGNMILKKGFITKNKLGVLNFGTFEMNNGEISQNDNTGVLNRSTFKMDGGLIDSNRNYGIANYSIFEMDNDSVVSNNTTSGVFNSSTFNMINGYIKGNGVNGVLNLSKFDMYNGMISEHMNESGLYNNGTFKLIGGVIENNKANQGGGVNNNGGTGTIEDRFVIRNNIAKEGGGIYSSGKLNLKGAQVFNNKADNGAGLYFTNKNSPQNTFIIQQGEIADNIANKAGWGLFI